MKQNTTILMDLLSKLPRTPPVIVANNDAEKSRVDAHRAAKHLGLKIVTRKVDPTTLHLWVVL